MCSLRDAAGELGELGVKIHALSLDDVKSLADFAEAQSLGFPLLSDPDGSAATKYGVASARGFARRVSFVIDPAGILRHFDEAVQVRTHGEDLAKVVRRLRDE